MSQTCKKCSVAFEITDNEKAFLPRVQYHIGQMMLPVPEPDCCPDCRCQLRVIHRNESSLYNNTSAFSNKPIISIYAPDTPFKVITQDEWWSDKWDGLDYGRDFDFSRSFFDQFRELQLEVPRFNLVTVDNENSPYTTGTGFCKNCHLINSSENCEDCYYGKLIQTCKDVVDSTYIYDSEIIYQSFNIRGCYHCVYLSYSQNCHECYFSEDLKSCRNCFLCTGLNQKQYYFMNQKMDKKSYELKVKEFLGSHTNINKALDLLHTMRKQRIYKYSNIFHSEHSTGDFILNCKDCFDCYDTNDSQDCRYVQVGLKLKDVVDGSNIYMNSELIYSVLGTIDTFHVIFSNYVFNSQNIAYSQQIYNSQSCFGCSGLRRKKYCILNKQYTKEDYEIMVAKIISHMQKTGEWGQFFPASLSPFSYNETLANDYFPLTKKLALEKGFRWRDEDPNAEYQGPVYQVPDAIADVQDDITQAILQCEITGKLYKVLPQELKFYRNMQLPVPKRCPEQRHKDRMTLRNPRQLYDRECMQCEKMIRSTFAPNRPEKVYCEECYLQTVY